MRIFQVITVSEYGGAQTIVADLLANLSPEHELFVLYGGEGEAWEGLGDGFTRIKLNKHRRATSWRDGVTLLKLFYYRIKYKPDVVHLHSSKMGALGRIAFNPRTIVYTVHGFDSIRKAHRKYLGVEKALKNRAAKIVGVSKYDTDNLKKEGITKNLAQVYNGVTDNGKKGKNRKDSITERLREIKVKYPHVVMCISRLSAQKKFDLFVEIAHEMPQHAFVWIGNKEDIGYLGENIFCLGESPDAYTYLNFADVFILPSNYEGLPMCLLEALSFGIPLVASDVGGVPELMNEGENGFAVENTPKAFSDKIDYILSDRERYKKMSKNARKSYEKDFTVSSMVNKYLSIFEEIATKRK